jgi:transposase
MEDEMQASTGTPTAGHSGTIFFSIELSQKVWLVTLHSPDRDKVSRHHVAGGGYAELLDLIERVRARVERKLGYRPEVASCYEAGYDGFWLHRLLMAAGIINYVFDPASIAVEQRHRRAKTDRIDGGVLLRTLMAYLRGEPRVVRIVHVPTEEQEDARRVTRERDRLVKERTAHVNRIKGLLRQKGIAVGKPRRGDWLSWLEGERDWQGKPLPEALFGEVKDEHERLMLISRQIADLERRSAEADREAAETGTVNDRVLLRRVKSLGPVFSAALANEVFYKDFRRGREVASYFGLAPSPWRSGGTDREQGISKAGNPRARQKAIELAWLWIRHQPGSALTEWFLARTANASKRIKRIAIVALARKLMVALWRYLRTGLIPEGAVITG